MQGVPGFSISVRLKLIPAQRRPGWPLLQHGGCDRVPRDRVPGCSPLTLVPAALRDGGQLRGVPVAVQVLGGAPGHDPLQPSVVGFAALRGGVVRQTQGHALAPQQELAVGDLKAKPSSAHSERLLSFLGGCKRLSLYRS